MAWTKGLMTKMCGEKPEEWDDFIDAALFAYRYIVITDLVQTHACPIKQMVSLYRTSRQDSSKYTPFELLYKRKARLPIEISSLPSRDNLHFE